MTELSNLLDMTLDDLSDIPTFEPYPAGVHRVLLSMQVKEVNGKQAVEVNLKAVETLELAEPEKFAALVAGAETSVLCTLGNEYGEGNLKLICTPLGEAMGTTNIGQIVEAANDFECVVVTGQRPNKDDKTKIYTTVIEVSVV